VHASLANYLVQTGRDPTESARKAIADSKAASEADPEYQSHFTKQADAYLTLGRYEATQGRDPLGPFNEALRCLERYLKKNPLDYFAHSNVGALHLNIARHEARRRGNPEPSFTKAFAAMNRSLEINPGNTSGWFNRGNAHIHQGMAEKEAGKDPRKSFRAAIGDFGEALKRNPGKLSVRFNRASAHFKFSRAEHAAGGDPTPALEKSLEDITFVLEKNSTYNDAHRNRGTTYLTFARIGRVSHRIGFFESAIIDFTRALALKPGTPYLLEMRGIARMYEAGRDPQPLMRLALSDFDQVLRIQPGNLPVHGERANLHFSLGHHRWGRGQDHGDEYRKALEDYRALLQKAPRYWQAWANLGFHLDRHGRYREAMASLRKALDLGGPGARVLKPLLKDVTNRDREAPWNPDLGKADDAFLAGKFEEARDLYGKILMDTESSGSESDRMQKPLLRWINMSFARALVHTSAMEGATKEERTSAIDKALARVRKGFDLGYRDFAHLRKDPGLAPLRELPEFEKLLKEYEGK
ncbi:MAG: tetratricopeptide repeat protein, partial [Planctomycetota bacterium]